MTKYLFLFLLTGTLFISSCQNDDDDNMEPENDVTITILEPSAGETIADPTNTHIHIRFEATDENHEIEVNLYTEDDPGTSIAPFPVDLHDHDQLVNYELDIDLSSFPAGTEFKLEAEACEDHDCSEKEDADISFKI